MIFRTLAIILFFAFQIITPIYSQQQQPIAESTIEGLATGTASQAQKVEEPVNLFETPRKTIRLFMSVMNDVEQGKTKNFNQAISALHLEEIPAENREAKSVELSNQLFKILNSFTFKIDAIPEQPKGKTYTLPIGEEIGVKIVLYRYDNDQWKFNYTRTLSKLNEYLDLIEKSHKDQEEDSTIDPVFKSARDSLNFYFTAMRKVKKEGPEEAIRALDMSRFEKAVKKDIGAERIAMLKSVLDRYKFIDLVEVPNDPKGPPYVVLNHQKGRIVIERIKQPDSNIESWLFSAQTVDDLPKLYDEFKNKPIVKGVSTNVDVPFSVRLRDYMKQNFPGLMSKSLFLENWQWIGMFCIIFLGLGISRLVTNILRKSITLIFKREDLSIDTGIESRFLKPISITLTSWSWWIGLTTLGLPGNARLFLLVTVKVITAISGIWAGYRLMDLVGNYLQAKAELTENKFDDLLVPLVTRTLKVLAIAIGLVFIADIFALDIDKILAGLGIGGLAFALAAKDTISNIFGSLTILIDRPFQIGDWVTIGAADGTVESVGVRSTRIRTFYNSLISIPNSQLITATIDNWGARKFRRITCKIGVTYDTPPDKIDAFCEGIREIIRKHPYSRKDYFHVYLNEFANSSLNILLYCFVQTPDWSTELREKHRLFNDIIRLAKQLGVEFAFPTQTLFVRNEEIPTHSNVPNGETEAFQIGQAKAAEVVKRGLGDPVIKPPPVSF